MPPATPPTADDPTGPEWNKQFVIAHFDDFVNRQDLGAIDRNMAADFSDHDGPNGRSADRDRRMMAGMYAVMPDLRVEVLSAVAEGEFVIVRNQWTGTNAQTGKRVEFHGFVQWRVRDGKITERWATVMPPHETAAETPRWWPLAPPRTRGRRRRREFLTVLSDRARCRPRRAPVYVRPCRGSAGTAGKRSPR